MQNPQQPDTLREAIRTLRSPPPIIQRRTHARAIQHRLYDFQQPVDSVRRRPTHHRVIEINEQLDKDQIRTLQEFFLGYQFSLTGKYSHSDHPLSHISRTLTAYEALDRLSHGLPPHPKIVDVGGKRTLWLNDPWYPYIRCTCPTLGASDVNRNRHPMDCACVFPATCAICQDPDAIVMIHSIYYLSPALVLQAVHSTTSKKVVATLHCFDGLFGTLPHEEHKWYKNDDQVVMVSTRGGTSYKHPDPHWVFASDYYQLNDHAMAWAVEHHPSGNCIVTFNQAPPGLEPSQCFYPSVAQNLEFQYMNFQRFLPQGTCRVGGCWFVVPTQGLRLPIHTSSLVDMVMWWRGKLIDPANMRSAASKIHTVMKDKDVPEATRVLTSDYITKLSSIIAAETWNENDAALRSNPVPIVLYNNNLQRKYDDLWAWFKYRPVETFVCALGAGLVAYAATKYAWAMINRKIEYLPVVWTEAKDRVDQLMYPRPIATANIINTVSDWWWGIDLYPSLENTVRTVYQVLVRPLRKTYDILQAKFRRRAWRQGGKNCLTAIKQHQVAQLGVVEHEHRYLRSTCTRKEVPNYTTDLPQKDCATIRVPRHRVDNPCLRTFGTGAVGIYLGSYDPIIARSCSHNEYHALVARVTRHTRDTVPCVTPNGTIPFWDLVDTYVLNANPKDFGLDKPQVHYDEEEWLAEQPPAKRELYKQGRDITTDARAARHNLFVKRENTVKGVSWQKHKITPRAIQGSTPQSNLQLGPYISAFSKYIGMRDYDNLSDNAMAYAWTGPMLDVWVNTKMEQLTGNSVDTKCADDTPVYISFDVVKMDSSHSASRPGSRRHLIKVLEKAGAPERVLNLSRADLKIYGHTAHGIQYEVEGSLPSGVQSTTLTNGWTCRTLMRIAHDYLKKVLNTEQTLLCTVSGGDDNLALVKRSYWLRALKAVIQTFNAAGFELTYQVSEYPGGAEFLSSRFWFKSSPTTNPFVTTRGGPYSAQHLMYHIAPKPFRQLAKLFWCHDHDVDPLERARAIALSTAHLINMPILGDAIAKVLELTNGIEANAITDYIKYHPSSADQLTREDFISEYLLIYGIGREDIEAISALIQQVTSLPARIDHPELTRCVEIDLGNMPTLVDYDHDDVEVLHNAETDPACKPLLARQPRIVDDMSNHTHIPPQDRPGWLSTLVTMGGCAALAATYLYYHFEMDTHSGENYVPNDYNRFRHVAYEVRNAWREFRHEVIPQLWADISDGPFVERLLEAPDPMPVDEMHHHVMEPMRWGAASLISHLWSLFDQAHILVARWVVVPVAQQGPLTGIPGDNQVKGYLVSDNLAMLTHKTPFQQMFQADVARVIFGLVEELAMHYFPVVKVLVPLLECGAQQSFMPLFTHGLLYAVERIFGRTNRVWAHGLFNLWIRVATWRLDTVEPQAPEDNLQQS